MGLIRFAREAVSIYRDLRAKQKAAIPSGMSGVYSQSTWWGAIRESFAGAWQRNIEIDPQTSLLAFSAVFACVTGIAADIAKLRIKLTEDDDGIWKEVRSAHGNSSILSMLLLFRKPNRYQNRIKFIEQWIVSKLLYGNAYILKQRDSSKNVVAMYVLNPQRVTVLVSDDGGVYYELHADYLSGVKEVVTVPASEIIHDMMVCLWHPLVGVSPIYACGTSATMGNRIQTNSTAFFANRSMPGGALSAPGHIADDTAARLKAAFEANFSGANAGRLAVLGDGLKFETFSIPAETAQLIEQLRWTVEDVARAFHYPQHKLGGPLPAYSSNLQALEMGYYTDCLQSLIESMELCLDEGLSLANNIGAELDIDNLMRMDTAALYESNAKAVSGGWMAPDEARFRAGYSAVPGGATPYLQVQNFSLEALAKRDALPDPFKSSTAAPSTPVPAPVLPTPKDLDIAELERMFKLELKEYAHA